LIKWVSVDFNYERHIDRSGNLRNSLFCQGRNEQEEIGIKFLNSF
jgi:hypothetical protein